MRIKGYPANTRPTHSRYRIVLHYLKDGRVVVQKWPRRRPGVLPAITQQQVALWDMAQEFVRWPEPSEYKIALDLTDGTAFYARDMLISSMYGNWVSWPGYGWRMVLAKDAQELLDAITDVPGALLVRSPGGWVGLLPGTAGDVLTAQGTGADPVWLPTAGPASSGLFSAILSATPSSATTGLTTWLNQSTASVADTLVGLTISGPSTVSTGSINARRKTAPSGTFNVTALLSLSGNPIDYIGAGIGFYDGTNKLQVFGLWHVGGFTISLDNWNTPTGYSGNVARSATGIPPLVWLRMAVTATTVAYQYSNDGVNFITLSTVTKSSGFLGAAGYSNIVFYQNAQNSAVATTLLSYGD